MEHLAPLLQTILWIGLIGGVIWRFHRPIDALLMSLQKRAESGSPIKAGPFEIGDLRPQDPKGQREKVQAEIRELLEVGQNSSSAIPPKSTSKLQNHYLRAEDLALRAIQAEYGVTVRRQVTAGADTEFDGAFTLRRRFYVVEVKYSFHRITEQVIRTSIERLISAIDRYNWSNVHLILVFVYEEVSGIVPDDNRLSDIRKSYSVPIEIRKYRLADLERQFGVSDDETG
jgi:hypothetical protein